MPFPLMFSRHTFPSLRRQNCVNLIKYFEPPKQAVAIRCDDGSSPMPTRKQDLAAFLTSTQMAKCSFQAQTWPQPLFKSARVWGPTRGSEPPHTLAVMQDS